MQPRTLGLSGVAGEQSPIMAGAHDKGPPATQQLMLQELKRVRTAIAHIHDVPIGGQPLCPRPPQATLAVHSRAFVRHRFVLADRRSSLQNLTRQAQHLTRLRTHHERMMTQPTPPRPVADLPRILQ